MARLVADADPDVVVVELGTNNCTAECPHLAAVIDRLMRSVPRTIPVVLAQRPGPTHATRPTRSR